MSFERPLYLVRASGHLLVAESLDELVELLACATGVGQKIELIHAYYSRTAATRYEELEGIAELLSRA